MKKFFGIGLLALLTTAYFTSSCSRDEFSGSLLEAKKATFNDNFIAEYGNIAPNHDWGFGIDNGTRAFTRAAADGLPDAPTFSRKPSKPSSTKTFYNTLQEAIDNVGEENVVYPENITDNNDWNSINSKVVRINATNYTVGANSYNMTIIVAETMSFDASGLSNSGDGCIICVPSGVTLTLTGTREKLSIYLASGANLDLSSMSTASITGDLVMAGNNTVTADGLYFLNSKIIANGGCSITATQIELDQNCTLWNEGTIRVKTGDSYTADNALKVKNTGVTIYNAASKTIEVGSIELNASGTELIYNDGTVTCHGAIELDNSSDEIINNGSLSGASLQLKAGGHYYNVGTTSISGLTKVSNANCGWQNDGQYTSGSFEVDQYSVKNYNNCKLTVTGNFWLNKGKFVLNGGIDGGASLICNTFTFEDTSNFYMGGKSLVLVNGALTTNNCNSSYGFRATSTTDYAVLKAESIVKGISDDQFHMSYYGKLYVDAGSHFAQGYKDTGFGQPYYFFDNDVKFSFAGVGVTDQNGNVHGNHPAAATIPVSIPVSSCTPGYNTTTTTTEIVLKQSGRVFCEDLGSVGATDIDYNDVVFDAWIYVKRTNNDPNTDVFYKAFIQPLAAGGTISAQIAGVDVHKTLFGVENDVMVNTYKEGASNLNSAAKHCEYGANGYNTMPSKIVITRSALLTGPNNEINIKYIPIAARTSGNVAVELTSISATDAPLKFMAPLGTPWAAERVKFGDAYTGFAEWVGDRNKTPWSTGQSSLVCNIESVPPTDAEIKAPVIDTNGNGVVVTGNTPTTPTTPQDNNPTAPTVTGPTGHEATWSGTQAFTVNADGSWSGNVSFDSNSLAFNNMGNGTYIRIYGYGTSNDWQVQLAHQLNQEPWTWTELTSYQQTGTNVNTSTTIEFGRLSAEEAQAIKDDGKLYVHGKNFVVKYIDIDNSGVTSDPINVGDVTADGKTVVQVLWLGPKAGYFDATFDNDKLASLQNGDKIRFYGIYQNGYQVYVHNSGWSSYSIPGWTDNGNNPYASGENLWNSINDTEGYFDLNITNDLATMYKDGCGIQVYNITLNYIVIVR